MYSDILNCMSMTTEKWIVNWAQPVIYSKLGKDNRGTFYLATLNSRTGFPTIELK